MFIICLFYLIKTLSQVVHECERHNIDLTNIVSCLNYLHFNSIIYIQKLFNFTFTILQLGLYSGKLCHQ